MEIEKLTDQAFIWLNVILIHTDKTKKILAS